MRAFYRYRAGQTSQTMQPKYARDTVRPHPISVRAHHTTNRPLLTSFLRIRFVRRRPNAGGEPVVTHPSPPQTRTCTMNAYGSSYRAAAALSQSPGVLLSGLVISLSVPLSPARGALSGGRLPSCESLGPHFSTFLGTMAATTATSPSQGAPLVARHPDPLCASLVRSFPAGLVTWSKRPDHARVCGHPVPASGFSTRKQVALPSSRATPMHVYPALRPWWCPAHLP
jgi:hypothetical protein